MKKIIIPLLLMMLMIGVVSAVAPTYVSTTGVTGWTSVGSFTGDLSCINSGTPQYGGMTGTYSVANLDASSPVTMSTNFYANMAPGQDNRIYFRCKTGSSTWSSTFMTIISVGDDSGPEAVSDLPQACKDWAAANDELVIQVEDTSYAQCDQLGGWEFRLQGTTMDYSQAYSACDGFNTFPCDVDGVEVLSDPGNVQVTFSSFTGTIEAGEVQVGTGWVYVDSGSNANVPASLSFEQFGGDTSLVAYRNGVPCGAECTSFSNDGNYMSFDVSGWSNYSYGPSHCTDGNFSTVCYCDADMTSYENYSCYVNSSLTLNIGTYDLNGTVFLESDGQIDFAGSTMNESFIIEILGNNTGIYNLPSANVLIYYDSSEATGSNESMLHGLDIVNVTANFDSGGPQSGMILNFIDNIFIDNLTTSGQGFGVYVSNASNSLIQNSRIIGSGSGGAFQLYTISDITTNFTIRNVTFSDYDDTFGTIVPIARFIGVDDLTVEDSTFFAYEDNFAGDGILVLEGVTNSVIRNNNISAFKSTDEMIVFDTYSEDSGYPQPDINTILFDDNIYLGVMNFPNKAYNLTFQEGDVGVTYVDINTTQITDTERQNLTFGVDWVSAGTGSEYDEPATITFDNINDAYDAPFRDGVLCNATYCSNINNDGSTLTFDVTGFSNYSYGFPLSGNGTAGNPYQITSVADMEVMAGLTDNEESNYQYFLMMNDINMSGSGWTPIADFCGELNGGGYTLQEMPAQFASRVEDGCDAEFNNIDVSFDIQTNCADTYCGGFVGSVWDSRDVYFENVSVTGFVNFSGRYHSAVFVGRTLSGSGVYFTNSSVDADFYGSYKIGMLIGWSDGPVVVNRMYVTGSVIATKPSFPVGYGGGLFSEVAGSAILNNVTLEDFYLESYSSTESGMLLTYPDGPIYLNNVVVKNISSNKALSLFGQGLGSENFYMNDVIIHNILGGQLFMSSSGGSPIISCDGVYIDGDETYSTSVIDCTSGSLIELTDYKYVDSQYSTLDFDTLWTMNPEVSMPELRLFGASYTAACDDANPSTRCGCNHLMDNIEDDRCTVYNTITLSQSSSFAGVITVDDNDTTLDLNGYSLTESGSSATHFIEVNDSENVVIEGGTITACEGGAGTFIELNNADHVTVRDVSLSATSICDDFTSSTTLSNLTLDNYTTIGSGQLPAASYVSLTDVDFYEVTVADGLTDLIIRNLVVNNFFSYDASFNMLYGTETVDIDYTGLTGMNGTVPFNQIQTGDDWVNVASASAFDQPATITFYDFTNSSHVPLKDGYTCTDCSSITKDTSFLSGTTPTDYSHLNVFDGNDGTYESCGPTFDQPSWCWVKYPGYAGQTSATIEVYMRYFNEFGPTRLYRWTGSSWTTLYTYPTVGFGGYVFTRQNFTVPVGSDGNVGVAMASDSDARLYEAQDYGYSGANTLTFDVTGFSNYTYGPANDSSIPECDNVLTNPTCIINSSDLYLANGYDFTGVNITVTNGYDLILQNSTIQGTINLNGTSRLALYSGSGINYNGTANVTVNILGYDARIYDGRSQDGYHSVFNVQDPSAFGWTLFASYDFLGNGNNNLLGYFASKGNNGSIVIDTNDWEFDELWTYVNTGINGTGSLRWENLGHSGFEYNVYKDGVLQENDTDYTIVLPGAFPGTDSDTLYIDAEDIDGNWSIKLPNIGLNKFSTSSCETYAPTFGGQAAVDGNYTLGNYWQCDSANAWHMIDLGVGVVGNVSSVFGDTHYGWDFTALSLDASNDNSSWVNIFTNQSCASGAGCTVTGYSVPENYRFWRINMTSPDHTAVAEFEYQGVTSVVEVAPEIVNGTINYTFENCWTLNGCGLNETGYNAGLNQSYITQFGGDGALYYNGRRGPSPNYSSYYLSFLEVPVGTTVIEYDVYFNGTGIAPFWNEVFFHWRLNSTDPRTEPYTSLYTHNSLFQDYMNLGYDFNGADYNISCDDLPSYVNHHVKVVLNYTSLSLDFYLNDSLDCSLDWSGNVADIGNLGELALLRTTTANAPDVYFDNIYFSNESTGELTACNDGLPGTVCYCDSGLTQFESSACEVNGTLQLDGAAHNLGTYYIRMDDNTHLDGNGSHITSDSGQMIYLLGGSNFTIEHIELTNDCSFSGDIIESSLASSTDIYLNDVTTNYDGDCQVNTLACPATSGVNCLNVVINNSNLAMTDDSPSIQLTEGGNLEIYNTLFTQYGSFGGEKRAIQQLQSYPIYLENITYSGDEMNIYANGAVVTWVDDERVVNFTGGVSASYGGVGDEMTFGDGWVSVETSSAFDTAATITLKNVNDANMVPYRDGVACNATYCSNIDNDGTDLTFDVTGFSNYSYGIPACDSTLSASPCYIGDTTLGLVTPGSYLNKEIHMRSNASTSRLHVHNDTVLTGSIYFEGTGSWDRVYLVDDATNNITVDLDLIQTGSATALFVVQNVYEQTFDLNMTTGDYLLWVEEDLSRPGNASRRMNQLILMDASFTPQTLIVDQEISNADFAFGENWVSTPIWDSAVTQVIYLEDVGDVDLANAVFALDGLVQTQGVTYDNLIYYYWNGTQMVTTSNASIADGVEFEVYSTGNWSVYDTYCRADLSNWVWDVSDQIYYCEIDTSDSTTLLIEQDDYNLTELPEYAVSQNGFEIRINDNLLNVVGASNATHETTIYGPLTITNKGQSGYSNIQISDLTITYDEPFQAAINLSGVGSNNIISNVNLSTYGQAMIYTSEWGSATSAITDSYFENTCASCDNTPTVKATVQNGFTMTNNTIMNANNQSVGLQIESLRGGSSVNDNIIYNGIFAGSGAGWGGLIYGNEIYYGTSDIDYTVILTNGGYQFFNNTGDLDYYASAGTNWVFLEYDVNGSLTIDGNGVDTVNAITTYNHVGAGDYDTFFFNYNYLGDASIDYTYISMSENEVNFSPGHGVPDDVSIKFLTADVVSNIKTEWYLTENGGFYDLTFDDCFEQDDVVVCDLFNMPADGDWQINEYLTNMSFSYVIADTTATTAQIDWTWAGDAVRTFVDEAFVIESQQISYEFNSLMPSTTYEFMLIPKDDAGNYHTPRIFNVTTESSDNNAPVIQETIINPSTGYTDTVFTGSCRATDIDNANIFYDYTWYVNGSEVESGTTGVATQGTTKSIGSLLTTNYVKGDNLTLSCIANDGILSSAELNDSTIILNSAAIIEDIFLIQVNGSDYFCNHTYSDADNDPQITPSYMWYANDVATGNTSSTVPISQFSVDDEIFCSVETGDGIGANDTANSSTYIVGDSNPPDYLRIIEYNPTVYTDTASYVEVECEDDEDNIGGGYPVLRMIDPNLVQRQYSFFWSGDPERPDVYYRYITYSVAGEWTNVNIECCDGNGNCIDEDAANVAASVRATVINIAGGGGGGPGGTEEPFREITSFNVIPQSVNYIIAPGNSVIGEIEIENTDIIPISFTVTSIRSEETPESYPWLKFSDNKRSASFIIEAQGGLQPSNRFLTYTIDVPADTPEGTYKALLEVNGFDQTGQMEITINVETQGPGLLGFLQQELFTLPTTRSLITGNVVGIQEDLTGRPVSVGLTLIIVFGLVSVVLVGRGAIRRARKR